MAKSLSQPKVVVVTGASAGVGRASAIEFAKQGAAVALLARGDAGLKGAAHDVNAAGGQALTIQVDVADADAVDRAALQIEQELGEIDVWVNAAFSSVFAPFTQITAAEFDRTTAVTYLGFVNGTRAALRHMLPRDRGVIVQVGSALSYRGIPLQSAYCGAKHAIQGFNESLRCELLHDKSNVHTTLVALPALNTPQFSWVLSRLPKRAQPVPPIYQPEVAARVVVAASRKRRREWWVGSSTVGALLGDKFMPGLLDRYLAATGYSSQQASETHDPTQPSNLFQPADDKADFGTHGSFDDRAKARSYQVEVALRRRPLALGAAGLVSVTLLLRRLRR